jgi:peptidoglycan hydrolase CwlO-like protein
MSTGGNAPVNTAYFTELAKRANGATSCAQLRQLTTSVTASVNGSVAAANGRISGIQAQASDLANEISDLTTHIGTLAAAQTTMTQLGTVAATSAGVSDLGSAIAYIKAQGVAMVTQTTAGNVAYAKQAIALATRLTKIQNDYSRITAQIASVQAQIDQIPAQLASFTATAEQAATKFPNCSL